MGDSLKVFIGYDPRQPVAAQVLAHSIFTRSSVPVSIQMLRLASLPIERRGLTEFTFSRYLVPWLCAFRGKGLFLDADMLCLGDIKELFDLTAYDKPVYVVKNKLRFEWPSLMLFNCNHGDSKNLTPDYIDGKESKPHTLEWASEIGDLPSEWNHLVGYDEPKPAKLIHFTAGIPCWSETQGCEYSNEWNREAHVSVSSVTWQELMGTSVHAHRVSQGMKI